MKKFFEEPIIDIERFRMEAIMEESEPDLMEDDSEMLPIM